MVTCICKEKDISVAETCIVEICPVTTAPSESRKQFVAFFNVQDFLIYRRLSWCVIWDRACHSKWKD